MNALTEKGNYILSRSYAYGVTASYLRTFTHLEDLIFANSNIIWKKDDFNNEYHVNRALNVWGSGKSHKNYFNKIDSYIKNIFNQPLDTQPKGIADMGCGDGSFLYHLYDLVENRRAETDKKLEDVHSRINTTSKEFKELLYLTEQKLMIEIRSMKNGFAERVGVLEKWRYLIIGGCIIAGLALSGNLDLLPAA